MPGVPSLHLFGGIFRIKVRSSVRPIGGDFLHLRFDGTRDDRVAQPPGSPTSPMLAWWGGATLGCACLTSDLCNPCSSVVRVCFSPSPPSFICQRAFLLPAWAVSFTQLPNYPITKSTKIYLLVNASTLPYPLPIHPMSSHFGVGFIPVALGIPSQGIAPPAWSRFLLVG
jgi:hypothetical protein